jgi:hypothetical protein
MRTGRDKARRARVFERRVSAWSPVASAGGRRSSDDGGSKERSELTAATQIGQGGASEGAKKREKWIERGMAAWVSR